MAKAKKDETTEATGEEASASAKQGAAVVLPNGQRRIDYIRDQYYKEGKKRGEIKTAINEMLEAAGQGDKKIAYQIVFAATKAETDPRDTPAAE